ncbi:hypothetical protein DFR76_11632 [Nocardia pseudobrasiliensis]|uniref:Uncharacterized protein n=1 Tax=Nocardia pseudobrasiliensis TaxID=45979 RepID=A0A370HPQ4_9NOCA|nr:hypothetical protein DFR76_11632 [Nocardia pseudobrasiliensis]
MRSRTTVVVAIVFAVVAVAGGCKTSPAPPANSHTMTTENSGGGGQVIPRTAPAVTGVRPQQPAGPPGVTGSPRPGAPSTTAPPTRR